MQDRQKRSKEIVREIAENTEHNCQLPVFAQYLQTKKNIVYPRFEINMLGLFAQTCQQAEAETAFFRLLPAVVGAEPESYSQEEETSLAAIAILKRHPELLFEKGLVTDHFGRKIFASPYQLFHGAADVWALDQIHDEILPNIENGEAKAQEQFQQQFPNCKLPFEASMGEAALYDDRNIVQIAQVVENLKSIVAVITADRCTLGGATHSETIAAVAKLCQLFAPKEGEVVRTGLHFPLSIIQEIFKVYDAQFDSWTVGQQAFFSREVIGAALAASTAVDGQCCKHGLSKLDYEKGPDRRDGLFCRHPKGIPQELAPLSDKLGRTMFVDPYDGDSVFPSSTPGFCDYYNKDYDSQDRADAAHFLLSPLPRYCLVHVDAKLMPSKNFRVAELMRPRREGKMSWSCCVIC